MGCGWGTCSVLLRHAAALRLIKASCSGNTSCIPVLLTVVNWEIVWGAAGIDLSLLRFCPHLMFTSTSCSDVSFGFSDTFFSGRASDVWLCVGACFSWSVAVDLSWQVLLGANEVLLCVFLHSTGLVFCDSLMWEQREISSLSHGKGLVVSLVSHWCFLGESIKELRVCCNKCLL